MCAVVATEIRRGPTKRIGRLAFDNSYVTNGEPVTPAQLGFENDALDVILIEPSGGYTFEYDHTNQKILVRYGDNNNAADGPLIEVPNATDLSALTDVRYVAFGESPYAP